MQTFIAKQNGRKNTNRNGVVDIYRLIAAIIIMLYHSYHLHNVTNYPFETGFIFVEAFFCLTGWFICSYIDRKYEKNVVGWKNAIIDSLKYTINKYFRFVPYVAICVGISLFFRHIVILKDFQPIMLLKALFESLMIIRGDSNVGVIWYLTALLPTIPIFYFLYLKINKTIMLIMSAFVFIGYYVILQKYPMFFPYHYVRAMAGLCGNPID